MTRPLVQSSSTAAQGSGMSTLTHPLQHISGKDHEGTVSIGGRTITNLCFADDIDSRAGEEEELTKLAERLDKASTVSVSYTHLTLPTRRTV